MKFVVENIFKCLVLLWKCYFPTNFSHFLDYFLSIQTNFIKKISKSQPTPHTTETPIQPTAANSGNQKPQPPKHHYHTTTQQQQKSKSQREIGGSRPRLRGGEIEQRDRRWDRSSDWSVRSGLPLNRRTIACDCRTWKRWSGLRRRRWRHDLASSPARSLSLSLSLYASDPKMVWSENLSFKPFLWSKAHFPRQLQIISGKYIFHAQLNTRRSEERRVGKEC